MKEKLLKIQQEIGAIKRDSENPYFKSKYFDINALLAEVKPILNKYKVVLLQPLTSVDGNLGILTLLFDTEDENEDTNHIKWSCPIPNIQDPQKAGSAITYFRRYALQSLLALEAEDDDANLASKDKHATTKPTGGANKGIIKPSGEKPNLPDKPPF